MKQERNKEEGKARKSDKINYGSQETRRNELNGTDESNKEGRVHRAVVGQVFLFQLVEI